MGQIWDGIVASCYASVTPRRVCHARPLSSRPSTFTIAGRPASSPSLTMSKPQPEFDIWEFVSCAKCHLPFSADPAAPPLVPFWLTSCGHVLCNNHISLSPSSLAQEFGGSSRFSCHQARIKAVQYAESSAFRWSHSRERYSMAFCQSIGLSLNVSRQKQDGRSYVGLVRECDILLGCECSCYQSASLRSLIFLCH